MYYTETMEMHCASRQRNVGNKSSSARRTKQNILMLVSNGSFSGKKKSRFIKNQESSGLLSK